MESTSAAKRKSSWQFRLGAVAGALLGIVATLGFLAVDLGKKPWSKDHQATNVDVGPVTRFTGEKATEVEVGNSGANPSESAAPHRDSEYEYRLRIRHLREP